MAKSTLISAPVGIDETQFEWMINHSSQLLPRVDLSESRLRHVQSPLPVHDGKAEALGISLAWGNTNRKSRDIPVDQSMVFCGRGTVRDSPNCRHNREIKNMYRGSPRKEPLGLMNGMRAQAETTSS